MRRLQQAASCDLGVQVPSGFRVRGWMLWLLAAVLILVGLGALIAPGGHDRLILAGALWLAAVLLVAPTFTRDATP
jgi:hypothetical protein